MDERNLVDPGPVVLHPFANIPIFVAKVCA